MAHKVIRVGRDIRERLAPVLSTSSFLEKGVLTPEEFVAAGDQLVYKCPTWSWESGKPSKARPYLPHNKQHLVTRGVPCYRRLKDLESDINNKEEVVDEKEGICSNEGNEEGWVVPSFTTSRTNGGGPVDLESNNQPLASKELERVLKDALDKVVINDEHFKRGKGDVDIQLTAPDLESYVDDNVVQSDDATLEVPPCAVAEEPIDGIIVTRTYDLSITYDKFYQTPRVWLQGYAEDGSLLKGPEMFEDIMDDYAHQTVTLDPHPHETTHQASVHPCKHAYVMKTLLNRMQDGGKDPPRPDQYLFIFLKFFQSVIPLIDYDFTGQVSGF
eukprot:252703_1